MKYPRMAAVAALSSLALVTACSGSEDEPTTDAATSTEATAGDDAAQTSDVAGATAEPDESEGVGALSTEQAEEIAADLLTKAAQVNNGDGEDIEEAAAAAYRGNAEVSALASDQLEEVSGQPEQRDLIANPVEPNVLAISRDDGQSPLLMLVQTVPESGLPELFVMASPGEPEDFRIVWSAPMLPGTDIGTFDRRSQGTPILREGAGDLPQSPEKVLTGLADYIGYPLGEVETYTTNGYAPQVRDAGDAQADAVAQQAEFTESNTLTNRTYTFIREDGSAVTFASLERESDFDVRSGMELTPPDEFLVFDDDESITSQATLNSYVYVAMTIPQDDGDPEMIAAREQLVSADGS
ncbi:MAG: hypothetical protein WBG36_16210 [Ornithinimicrobium sp.]